MKLVINTYKNIISNMYCCCIPNLKRKKCGLIKVINNHFLLFISEFRHLLVLIKEDKITLTIINRSMQFYDPPNTI